MNVINCKEKEKTYKKLNMLKKKSIIYHRMHKSKARI